MVKEIGLRDKDKGYNWMHIGLNNLIISFKKIESSRRISKHFVDQQNNFFSYYLGKNNFGKNIHTKFAFKKIYTHCVMDLLM